MANKNGKMPQPEYDDKGDTRSNSSVRRYRPGLYDTQQIGIEIEEEEYEQPDSAVPRRGSVKLVAPLILPVPNRQPARQRDTEAIQQIKTKPQKLQVQQVEPVQPKQPMLSRRNLLLGGGLVATACASVGGVVWMGSSLAITKWYEYWDQLNSGNFPSVSKSIVCGHNNDSNINKTDLHACVLGDHGQVFFLELPAGDSEKGHLTRLPSLRALGYQGSLANVSLQLNHIVVEGAHQINMIATCRDVALLAEPEEFEWILTSNKGYFQLAK